MGLIHAIEENEANATALLHRITNCLSRSLALSDMLNAIVAEVGEFLESDRVKVYQFHSDESGCVVAEWIRDQRLPSLLGLNFPVDDIPQQVRKLFAQHRLRAIVDLPTQKVEHTILRDNNGVVVAEPGYHAVDPCHGAYLTAMGVQSSFVVPILHHNQLWGLLVVHNVESHPFSEAQIQTVQLVIDWLSVALSQWISAQKACEQANKETALNRISRLLHSLSTIEFQAALEETISTFNGSGGQLWIQHDPFQFEAVSPQLPKGCLYQAGQQPCVANPDSLLTEYSEKWQTYFTSTKATVWASNQCTQQTDLPDLQAAFANTSIAGILVIPLWYRQQLRGYLSIFRDQVETEILWAGRVDPDQRQRGPRRSFEVWKESRQGRSLPWSNLDLELATALGQQFASAIIQQETHQALQAINQTLEFQIKERTAQLQAATEQQQVLFQVVTRMRQSLKLETIFKTVTEELRRSLQVDRVCIYRFDQASFYNFGDVIAEDVLPPFPKALGSYVQDHCFGERYANYYRLGRVSTISDLSSQNLQDCYRELLERFAIRANIIAPLMNGETLWGLLCVHQCDRPRDWTESEIQFVSQVAAQLSIGLEQADLLTQTQHQAQQLADALQSLQKTQSQLIQTEKMSSLGHLVAGVAHEINNPVNFIHGNLNHVNASVQNLLNLVKTYQSNYPNPVPEILEQEQAIDLDFLAEDLPKMLTSMHVGTDRIRQIVLSLRNFSRLDQAEMKLVDIHEGIDSTLLILQHRFNAKSSNHPGVELIREYGELPFVECFAGQLNQVFMNLLSNALDALEEVPLPLLGSQAMNREEALPTIRIRTEQLSRDRIAIRISDNGRGIPAEIESHVFEPFFTTKAVGKGTGMGLSICWAIVVDKHGGALYYQSEPGQGTEFVVEIPLQQGK